MTISSKQVPWNKGKHGIYSQEHIEKLRAAGKGRHQSKEAKMKLSLAHKGKHLSSETKRKLSEINSGEKNPNFGLIRTAETRLKISERLKGRILSEEWKRKMSESRKGIYHSEEEKNKISLALKGITRSKETRNKISKARIGIKFSDETRLKMSGSNSPHWKGGVTPLRNQIRACFKYRQWRSDIFTKDDYTCVLCGKRGNRIEADHYPKSFSQIFYENQINTFEQALECEEFWDINNGRTLCHECHDKNKRSRYNQKEQMDETFMEVSPYHE